MIPKVIPSPEAEQDLAEIAEYLAERSCRTALRFLDAAEAAFGRLAEMPELGAVFESVNPVLSNLRVWSIHGFQSYLIFYRPSERGIEVVRVLHGARDLDKFPRR